MKVPDLSLQMARQAVELVQRLRQIDLKKDPSISETLDWARALLSLNAARIESEVLDRTLGVLLKHESDLQRARLALRREQRETRSSPPKPRSASAGSPSLPSG